MADVSSHTSDNEATDYCPLFQHAIELIGRRWTGSILKAIGSQSLRFGEIRAAIPGLSDRLLDTRLTELETEDIIRRTESDGEVRYCITEKGLDLQPVFASVSSWVETHADGMIPAQPGRRRC